MTAKVLKEAMKRVETWLDAAQEELTELKAVSMKRLRKSSQPSTAGSRRHAKEVRDAGEPEAACP